MGASPSASDISGRLRRLALVNMEDEFYQTISDSQIFPKLGGSLD